MELNNKILSDITVHMKYARYNPELKRRETWEELVTRNMNMHIKTYPKLMNEILMAYAHVSDKKVLPSMRSMQFGGKPIEISPNRIYNCAYMPIDNISAFSECMFLLLGGTGVGYSVQQHHVEKLPLINKPYEKRTRRYLIGDSIEGWADSIKMLMKSYLNGKGSRMIFDYSDIRSKGARLVTSGGKAPGPQPLKECILKITGILDNKEDGDQLTTLETHDIICHIADAVLAGGIRRAALISLFSAHDDEMISCKSGSWWELNPQRGRANNSAVLMRHKITKSFFMDLWKRVELSKTGEPGIYFNNDKDWGTNPCCEIALRPFQFCNLCEVNVSNIESQEDLEGRVKAAAFIGTLQAGYTNFHYLRPIWQDTTEKDALIGVSMTGIGSGRILLQLNLLVQHH
jgi:ribonucleoside-triphosphate reductase